MLLVWADICTQVCVPRLSLVDTQCFLPHSYVTVWKNCKLTLSVVQVSKTESKFKPWNCNSVLHFSWEAIIWHPVTVNNQNWGCLNFNLLHNQSIVAHATEPENATAYLCSKMISCLLTLQTIACDSVWFLNQGSSS